MAQVTRDILDLMLQSNTSTVVETVKSFVQIMFEGVQRQINDIKNENSDLKQSLEFTQANVLDLENTIKNATSRYQESPKTHSSYALY